MDWTKLDKEERLALAALARTMIRLDRDYSREEAERLQELAEQLGDPEALWDAIGQAEQTITTPQELEALALRVTRPEARELILEVLETLASVDTITPSEGRMLDELRKLWAMPVSG